jgi:hypothetical protein
MMMLNLWRTCLAALAGMALLPVVALAQQDTVPPPPGQQQAELVAEREVFRYPLYERRNPFRALVAGVEGAPRFDQLRLMGIIYSDDPGSSVAIVGTSIVQLSEDATTVSIVEGRSWYLKVGQSIGNIRVIEIRREQVVMEVEEYGLTERKIMQLETRRLGGTP